MMTERPASNELVHPVDEFHLVPHHARQGTRDAVIAFVLRGRGGDKSALGAAQGGLFTEGYEPGKP